MAQVIRPEDFNTNVNDPVRNRWTFETISNVVEALGGAEVLVETDNGTGHAWNFRLTQVNKWHLGGAVLCIGRANPDGLWYPIASLGIILDPDNYSNARDHALSIARERSAK